MPKSQIKLNFLFIFLPTLVIASLFIFWVIRNYQSSSLISTHCDQANIVINSVLEKFSPQKTEQENASSNPSDLSFDWKREASEPYVFYNGQVATNIYIHNTSVEQAYQTLNQKIYPILASEAFLPNKLNILALSKNPNTGQSIARFAFTKGSDLYLITLTSFSTLAPDRISQVSIRCGSASMQYDQIYQRIILNSHFSPSDEIYIWEIKDHVVKINVTNFQTVGGFAQYWVEDGPNLKKVYQGQDDPPCSIFENLKVGQGLSCI